ncbi:MULTISPECIES: ester cyclase [Pseudofrankia]|uniref:ester cyclase n=1 Tax=Pseudofrankia TaxID=2994363 RepID=UPI000234B434|nr:MULTISPECIES: ester cyclase [Pseudofrankia]OHV31780.1 hypothetical protein BCD49_05695 [Pseudofrankia sp. EUN1h]
MTNLISNLMRLWSQPLPTDDDAAEAAFRQLYTDPVTINGAKTTAVDLVVRARALQGAFEGLAHELVDRVEAPGKIVIGFYLRGRHTGPYPTPLGIVAPTGLPIEVRTTDILTVTDGLVSDVWVVSEELGLLTQLGAVALASAVG